MSIIKFEMMLHLSWTFLNKLGGDVVFLLPVSDPVTQNSVLPVLPFSHLE
jgi:hypothetical protein